MSRSKSDSKNNHTVYLVAFLSLVYLTWDLLFNLFLMYRIQDFRLWLSESEAAGEEGSLAMKVATASWFLLAPALLWDIVALAFNLSLLTYGYQSGRNKRESKGCTATWMVLSPVLTFVFGDTVFAARAVGYYFHARMRGDDKEREGVVSGADPLSTSYVFFVTVLGAGMHLLWLSLSVTSWRRVCAYRDDVSRRSRSRSRSRGENVRDYA